jgi:HPt (histidine-containing phosphotransfer) domain-containing protein
VTAHALQGDRERCLAAGMDGYVTKPLTSRQLAGAIHGFFPDEPGTLPIPEPPAVESHAAIAWDRARTLARLEGDTDLLDEVVGIFLDEAPRQLAGLRKALENGDAPTAAEMAHSLKGQLGYFGIAEVSSRARRLEDLARAESLHDAAAEYPVFAAEIEAVMQSMRAAVRVRAAAAGETA